MTPLLVFDLVATLVFALEGGLVAQLASLDLLGVLVLAFAVALGGGLLRDLLIGAVPPNALSDVRYPFVAFAGGALALLVAPIMRHIPEWLLLGLDAAGLSLFAVTGAQKARDKGLPFLSAVLLGAMTGAGGGTIRDILLARIPLLLRADVYATAAMLGAAVHLICLRRGWNTRSAGVLGVAACFVLRIVSIARGWSLRL
ncbi:MAG: TRIC cation channel family protein [Myxococcales bacterium]